jgi:hypothetical protein
MTSTSVVLCQRDGLTIAREDPLTQIEVIWSEFVDEVIHYEAHLLVENELIKL